MPNFGQLYYVNTRGRMSDGSVEKLQLIMTASSRDEVEIKIRYAIDLSEYREFQITAVSRVKPNFHILSRVVVTAEQEAIKSDNEYQIKKAQDQTSPTLQSKKANVFAFGLVGYLIGKNSEHVMRKLGRFLLARGVGENVSMPFIESGHFLVEEIGPSDSTKVSNLSKSDPYIFRDGRIVVQGGGCSPK